MQVKNKYIILSTYNVGLQDSLYGLIFSEYFYKLVKYTH